MSRREATGSRRPPVRRSHSRVLVVCGGIATEPAYLDGLKRHAGNRAVTLRIRSKGIAPAQLVEFAVRCRDHDSAGFDEVWCVVDVDEFDLSETVRAARAAGISLAVSNPCFELWLLLHYEECRSHLASYAAVCSRLQRHVPNYDKTALDFGDYSGAVPVATARAKALDPTGTDHQRNPSTGVWRLVEIILEKP